VSRTVITDDVGSYRLTGLPPGVGELTAKHAEYGTARMKVRLKYDPTRDELELPDLIVSPMVEVSGTVVASGGGALPGALISGERIAPYLPAGAAGTVLATADENGEFTVKVGRDEPLYLYAAVPGRAYGFSDGVQVGDLDRVSDVKIIVDRKDKLPPNEQGTVLVALEQSASGLLVYAVAEGSQAARTGLRVDDVIVEIDDVSPRGVKDARELLSGLPGSDLRVVIDRRGSQLELLTSREAFLR
jgi:hypothetical protein